MSPARSLPTDRPAVHVGTSVPIAQADLGAAATLARGPVEAVRPEGLDVFAEAPEETSLRIPHGLVLAESGPFVTGQPVDLDWMHNPVKAPKVDWAGQDKEPGGFYVSERDTAIPLREDWEGGRTRLATPLVVAWGGQYGESTNWKEVISAAYGGKTGEDLSQALRRDGFDAVVTLWPEGTTSEIILLGGAPPAAKVAARFSLEEVVGRHKVDAFAYEHARRDVITLSRVVVDKKLRGQGIGSAFMRDLAAYADAVGRRIELTPSTDFGATSVTRLKVFYKQFGFVENKGRHKDFTTSETMYREPRPCVDKPVARVAPLDVATQQLVHQAQALTKDDRLYEVLGPYECGAFDGGCLICADALILAAGRGELVRLVNPKGRTDHYGARIDGHCCDFSGAYPSGEAWAKAFARLEHIEEPLRLAEGLDPKFSETETPRDPRCSFEVAQLLNGGGTLTVYHGSRHDFEAFSEENIGKGTGGESYAQVKSALTNCGDFDPANPEMNA